MIQNYYLGFSEEGFHRIAYSEWGKENPAHPPVICVHGLTRNKSDFDSLASTLSGHGLHVFCLDIAGRGDSDWLEDPGRYNYLQYCLDLTTLIARTGRMEIDWIGTSMGGILGMLLASRPKSPIRRLVMNDIGPYVPAKALRRLATYTGKAPEFRSLEDAMKYFKLIYADFGHLSEAQWQHLVENSVMETEPDRFVLKIDPAIKATLSPRSLAGKMLRHPLKTLRGELLSVDLWKYWRKVSCPVLLIHGKNSDILTSDTIEKMQSTHREMDVFEVPDAGHAPSLTDTAQQELIYKWLTF